MIKYITNSAYGCKIYKIGSIELSKHNNLSIIKNICINYLFTYDGYLKAISKFFSFRHNIPVYINDTNQYIPTKRVRDYENIWINYSQVLTFSAQDNETMIVFNDYETLIIDLKYHLFVRRVEMLEKIKNYKTSQHKV